MIFRHSCAPFELSELHLDQASEVESLIADIHGISRKPQRGDVPRYVKDGARWPQGMVDISGCRG